MPTAKQSSAKSKRRKRWFHHLFSLKALMVLMVFSGGVGYLWMYRANRQFQIVTQLSTNGEGVALGRPLPLLGYLPQSWLLYGGGHWCSTVDFVRLPVNSAGSREYRIVKLGANLKLAAELSVVKSLQIESLPSLELQKGLKETLAPLANIGGLRSLSLDINSSLNPLLTAMPALPWLTMLKLSTKDSNVAEGLSHLDKFPRLKTLTFESDVLEADGLRLLAGCEQTKLITARKSLFTADEMECLRGHPSLESFVSSSTMTNGSLEVLGTIPKLRSINAARSLITDVGLSHLAKLKDLEEISLDGTTITDAGLAFLSNCTSLKKISCVGCKITDESGPTLSRFTQLQSLDLKKTLVSGKVLSHLMSLKNLQHLGFEPYSAHIDDLVQFASASSSHVEDDQESCYSWSSLNYRFNPSFVATAAPQVNPLCLSGLKGISRRMHQIRDVQNIGFLYLSHTDVDDQDLKDLTSLCNPNLLQIDNTSVTAMGLTHLLNQRPPSYLSVGPFENSEEATGVIGKFSNLRSLTLFGTNELSRKAKDSILQLAALQTLHLTDLPFEESFARELCKLPDLGEIQWCDKQWNIHQIEDARLRLFREQYPGRAGIYLYMSKRWPKPTSAVTIVSPQEFDAVHYDIEHLNASGVPLTKEQVNNLNYMYRMSKLDLSHSGITDDMLQQLNRSRPIYSVDLSNNPIVGTTLQTAFKSTLLNTLNLSSTEITDQSLSNLLTNLELSELDISNTRITERAWDQILSDDGRCRIQRIGLQGIAALPQILNRLKDMPRKTAPEYVSVSQGFYILTSNLRFFFGARPTNDFFKLGITPEMLQIWQLESLLGGKRLVNEITTARTNYLASVLPLCKRECPLLYSLGFEHEQIDPAVLSKLSPQIRELKLFDCTLTTEALKAITRACPSLVSLTIDSCQMENCSLEPLTQARWLSTLIIRRSVLTPQHRHVLKQLRKSISVSG